MAVTMPDYFHANFHLLLSFQLSTSDIRRLCSSASLQKCLLGLFPARFFTLKCNATLNIEIPEEAVSLKLYIQVIAKICVLI